MRQTYNILDQGPSNGPGYQRPQTIQQQKGLKERLAVPLLNHPKQYNIRRTENTIYAQDYLKQWKKIEKFKPVLRSSKNG